MILVGEMRDLETISLAITCAEMGNLVFGTLHTNSAAKTIDRIIDVFPADQQEQIRTMLSVSLKGVCAQLLLRKVDGPGRVPVNEIMFGTPRARRHDPRGRDPQDQRPTSRRSRGEGMQLMDDSIMTAPQGRAISRPTRPS